MITQDDAREYCDTLLRHFLGKLSEWEDGFVRSVTRQIKDGRPLSDKQLTRLDDIMETCADRFSGNERE